MGMGEGDMDEEAAVKAAQAVAQDASYETLVPPRLLNGLMPQALLDTCRFWQGKDDMLLRGYPQVPCTVCACVCTCACDVCVCVCVHVCVRVRVCTCMCVRVPRVRVCPAYTCVRARAYACGKWPQARPNC